MGLLGRALKLPFPSGASPKTATKARECDHGAEREKTLRRSLNPPSSPCLCKQQRETSPPILLPPPCLPGAPRQRSSPPAPFVALFSLPITLLSPLTGSKLSNKTHLVNTRQSSPFPWSYTRKSGHAAAGALPSLSLPHDHHEQKEHI